MRRRPLASLVALWVVVAAALAAVATHVTDWFVMTDELVYERLALSVARTGSPLPQVHGTAIRSLDQLYPLLIAPFFRFGSVADAVRDAHVVGAVAMTSAAIPAFLLARRVTGRAGAAWAVAAGTVVTPWLLYSFFLLTEPVAYPAFLWGALAAVRAVEQPSARRDAVALLAALVAFLARTELVVLAVALPLAILLVEAGAPRRAVRLHPLLAAVYAALVVAAAGFVAAGGSLLRLSVYGQQIPTHSWPSDLPLAATGHVAQLAFSVGILPFVAGTAWLLANCVREREPATRAFACVAATVIVLLVAEVTKYDLGIGPGTVYDRYLFYAVPLVLIGFAAALEDARSPRWSLALPLVLVCLGFALRPQADFTWRGPRVSPDSPPSLLYRPLADVVGSKGWLHALLVGLAVALTLAFAAARRLRPLWAAATGAFLIGTTAYVLVTLFGTTGYSGRPLTAPVELSWVDGLVGRDASVTTIPYHVSTDYLVTQRFWRDLEFWNASVTREAQYAPAAYVFTGIWFPKVALRFDASDGAASASLTEYAVQSVTDTRFALAGTVISQTDGAQLIRTKRPWRASFLLLGAYDDGWLKPHTPATVRVFATPRQRRARIHYLSLQVWAPGDVAGRPFEVRSNVTRVEQVATNARTTFVNALAVCVPPGGHADVTLTADGASTIPGDLSSYAASLGHRVGSIYLADASISDDLGPLC